ncbi:MAG: tRNA lysidine(34) synthetase TilS, partial [Lachnospiraceae bacterium]|nr:tRNA lysidine(34) synthetase TilS [Lachnospiraceae bacterium]
LILEAYRKEDGIIRRELLKRALQLCGGGMKDVGSVHLEMLERLADMDCGKQCDLPGGICAVREEGILRFTRKNPDSSDLSDVDAILKPITLLIPGCSGYGNYSVITELTENTPELKKCFLEEKKYTKWLSYDTIGSNLQLRTRRAGDYLVINAQGGMKKLKDYFIDRKIPQTLRDQILLLADGSHILWVVGYRISEAAKVTEETKQVIKIQILQGEQK